MYFSKKDIETRRNRLSQKWDLLLKPDEAVLVYSGEPIQKPGGLDQCYPFLPHPAYFWLTGRRRESEVIFYNRNTGWIEFHKEFTTDQAVWEGEKNDILVSQEGKNILELDKFLSEKKFSFTYKLGQVRDGNVSGKTFDLRTALDQTRRIKDGAELQLIRQIAQIAAKGYEKIAAIIKPGITEKEIQIVYESEISRQGSHGLPYETIVGSGTNAAVLHALPTKKVVGENEFVLVDAGADIFDYCVDITRTYATSDPMDGQHKALYDLVLRVEKECIAMARPGVLWRDVHIHAATQFTSGLLELGLLKGNLSTLLEKEVAYVFFPHGLGHLVGLRVRDTGQEENVNPRNYFGARLRVDITLEENHLVTVEPGCYFMKALIENPEVQKKFRDDISWKEVGKWIHLGGVRIEDNIVITKQGSENLTVAVPK